MFLPPFNFPNFKDYWKKQIPVTTSCVHSVNIKVGPYRPSHQGLKNFLFPLGVFSQFKFLKILKFVNILNMLHEDVVEKEFAS